MEQITLTKLELEHIIERAINKKLNEPNVVRPVSIFSEVKIQENEIAKVNERFSFIEFINKPYRGRHFKPLALRKFNCGGGDYFNGKVHDDHIHDHMRKLTLSLFGVSKNSDLNEEDYEQASEMYKYFKDLYLHLYNKRISKLTINDFE
ncbi:hypothetical protein ACP3TM_11705 [Staphylococcus sp. IPLA37010]|uniref:Phage protein n=1 Tax=Staphylococcus equorum TaxID=246432 RepID=A0AAW7AIB6_9STAP|nr:hypothetical protein [Staphylococcus equorum]MDK9865953.1 hypothetical protein [Staphylococcus equorum]